MPLPDIFSQPIAEEMIRRIEKLTPGSKPLWGVMDAAQVLAHMNVTYEMIYEDKHPKPPFLMKLILKSFVKNIVTNEVPYKKSSRTAPAFLIKDAREFELEKSRLVAFIRRTLDLGEHTFNGKESHSFGRLTIPEWNNMMYKHLDHHLRQFGV